MDCVQLAEEICRKIGVKVGLRFSTISVNSKEKITKDQMVGAIHIEINKRNYIGNKEKVSCVYESKQIQGFPLGIKMQLCPQAQDATDPAPSTEFDEVWICLAAFLANIQRTNTRYVGVLDYLDPLLILHTIRSIVLSWIFDRPKIRKKVFISVDKHFRGNGVCFQYTNTYINKTKLGLRVS
jgi:hypothetical protein